MGIEQDIQQAKFKSIYQKRYINILFTSSFLNSVHSKSLKKFDISTQQFNLLRILRGQFPKAVNLNDIACRMIDKSSNASRLVEKLRNKGFIKREIATNDRRAVEIVITEEGLNLLKELDQVEGNFFEELKKLSEEEAAQLSNLLDKIREK